ncbi:MAG: MOSC domain-containing protein [Gammaproteobacteria bacterium]|nr:MOSC domain-containing protein [Gammaproteobacteria bacterium]
MTEKPIGRIRAVLAGGIRRLGRNTTSAIAKQELPGRRQVGQSGIAGDCQADRRVHGGVDKAVHCYPFVHYATWRAELPPNPLLDRPGAFGENLSIDGLTEHEVFPGDRWRIGSVLFELSQGRRPCHKLNLRFGVADMAVRLQATLRTGWYLRVIDSGELQAGDAILLVARPHPSHSVADLIGLIRDQVTEPAQLEPVLRLPLPASWRALFERRLRGGG